MNVSIITLVFLAISSQGFFLALILFTSKRMHQGKQKYLGAFILSFSIILLFWVGFWNGLESRSVHFNFLYNPLPYLPGPLLFLYVKSFYKDIRKFDLIHFLPFLLVLSYFTPIYFLEENLKIEILKNKSVGDVLWMWDFLIYYWDYLNLLCFIFYSAIIYKYIRSHDFSSNLKEQTYLRKWLNTLLILFSLFTVLLTLSYILVDYLMLSINTYYFAGAFIGIIIYLIGYLGLNHTRFVYALESVFKKKYEKSALRKEDAPLLIEKIISYIENKKPFLNSDFKLADLSSDLGMPSNRISELLNSYHKKSFSELINHYRIEEAKRLLVSANYQNYTVSVVGYDVGFNSRTSFYNWFKKLTGESPSLYQKKYSFQTPICSKMERSA